MKDVEGNTKVDFGFAFEVGEEVGSEDDVHEGDFVGVSFEDGHSFVA